MFTDPEDAHLGAKLLNAALTRAIGGEGDTKIILGFANNEYVARQAIGTHSRNMAPLWSRRALSAKRRGACVAASVALSERARVATSIMDPRLK